MGTKDAAKIYAGRDPRDIPAYPQREAARYLRLHPATLRSWVAGRGYQTKRAGSKFFRPLITPADPKSRTLSFSNLIEAHVLRALRTQHSVPLTAVRDAIAYAQEELGINRILLSRELRTHAGEVLLDKYGHLISLSRSGQLAMRQILEAHLRRVEWDVGPIPVRLYPFLTVEALDAPKVIAIDPRIAFGRPVVFSRGVSTAAIIGRIDAGESVEAVAEDYELGKEEVEQAVLYELAAA